MSVAAEDASLWGSKHQPLEPVIESELRKSPEGEIFAP